MRPYPRLPGQPVRLALGAALLIGAPVCASAQQRTAEANRCAIYGAGYVAVMGGEGCARIGERVRVDVGGGPRAVAAPGVGVSAAPLGALGFAPAPADRPAGPSAARAPLGAFGADLDLPRTR